MQKVFDRLIRPAALDLRRMPEPFDQGGPVGHRREADPLEPKHFHSFQISVILLERNALPSSSRLAAREFLLEAP